MEMKRRTLLFVTLNIEEAEWLKGLLQNPIPSFEEELDKNKEKRELLWTLLNNEI